MKRYLIPIIIISVLVSGLLLGCDSEPASSEYQQQINEFEQQIQSLSQQIDSLEESISSLEGELETPPSGASSDFEARIEQQIAQLEEQIDELSAEVSTINNQLTEQGAEEEEVPSTLEAPSDYSFKFSGRASSTSPPFQVTTRANKLVIVISGQRAPIGVFINRTSQKSTYNNVYSETLGTGTYETYIILETGESYMYVTNLDVVEWTIYLVPQ